MPIEKQCTSYRVVNMKGDWIVRSLFLEQNAYVCPYCLQMTIIVW